MEDAHAIELKLDAEKDMSNAFFAVYDGHGGGTIARFSGENVHKRLQKEDDYQERQWGSALKKAFLGTDEDIRSDPAFFRDPSGCTAVAALVTDDKKIIVANAGDSRSVLSVKGEAKPLSFDHKPMNETEMQRIRKAGGYIEYGRVNGNLSLSRAIGDFQFKTNHQLTPEQQIITADPDITEHLMTEEDEFLIIACDGIWDCLTSQQAVSVVRSQIAQGKELSEVCEFICDHCLAPDTTSGAGVGCDNMTVMVVALLNGRTKQEWYDWIKERVEKGHGFETPTEPPQIYSVTRINAFKARRQAAEERNVNRDSDPLGGSTASTALKSSINFAQSVLGRGALGGGISFHPDKGIISDEGSLMFTNLDSDEDDSDEDEDVEMDSGEHQSFLASLGLRPPLNTEDVITNLRARLDAIEDGDTDTDLHISPVDESDEDNHDHPRFRDEDDDEELRRSEPDDEAQQAFGTGSGQHSQSDPPADSPDSDKQSGPPSPPDGAESSNTPRRRETPPPVSLPNGDASKARQLDSQPGGDAAPSVAKIEGLLDKSEDPVKA
ncbi:PP2C-domain-containing protein [Schizopora paradoxa]|uniref:protein-serine/threonine phosphatase n=1 Tax=Schizopora paradoxa TaxID=27342 RepID=A0A0H2RPU8_9AGAM|nr:PP2C-domain-containing protein [Schizopora paradoxa]